MDTTRHEQTHMIEPQPERGRLRRGPQSVGHALGVRNRDRKQSGDSSHSDRRYVL